MTRKTALRRPKMRPKYATRDKETCNIYTQQRPADVKAWVNEPCMIQTSPKLAKTSPESPVKEPSNMFSQKRPANISADTFPALSPATRKLTTWSSSSWAQRGAADEGAGGEEGEEAVVPISEPYNFQVPQKSPMKSKRAL